MSPFFYSKLSTLNFEKQPFNSTLSTLNSLLSKIPLKTKDCIAP